MSGSTRSKPTQPPVATIFSRRECQFEQCGFGRIAAPARSPTRPPNAIILWVAGWGSGLVPLRKSLFRDFSNGHSRIAQIPIVILRGDFAVEAVLLGAFDAGEHLNEPVAEIIAHHLGSLEQIDRREPVGGQILPRFARGGIAVAHHRRPRIDLVDDAVMRRRQHGGERQIRIGVGAGHAVLDVPGDRKSTRLNSEEHTSELQSLMRISYAVFCLKKKKSKNKKQKNNHKPTENNSISITDTQLNN